MPSRHGGYHAGLKYFGVLPLFDPQQGQTVLEPPAPGAGNWSGAPSVIWDDDLGKFFLYYRVRRPRPIRGGECRIAASSDGLHFDTVWSATKEQIGTSSMERSALVKCLDGQYRLYLAYVDPDTGQWRTDVCTARAPDQFDVSQRTKVFTPADVGIEGVKDPVVLILGREYHMILSYAQQEMHATGDVYNTGITRSASALALSRDGVHFDWIGDIFSPAGAGWDAYCRRLGSALWTPPVFTCFYDGSRSVRENYEERTGMAYTFDLRHYTCVTPEAPILTSPHASGSLRYIEALRVGDQFRFYYEYVRPDGSHELRLSTVCAP